VFDLRNIEKLEMIANDLRIDVIKSVFQAQSGHIGGSLSCADIMAALYFHRLRIDPENPVWEDRDRFVLSKGHAAPVLYAALARRGFFDTSELMKLRTIAGLLQGAPSMAIPGVDMSSGPLGQGLSAAVGMALGCKYLKKSFFTYCIIGDGEMQEGQIWEALMAAAKFNLANLVVILDYNKVQMCGTNDEIMPVGDPCAKFAAFGWKVIRINGHDMKTIVQTLDAIDLKWEGMPTAIVADTIKGKGVSYMEGLANWHGMAPNQTEYEQALLELGWSKNDCQ
jgi:transketolase